MPTPGITAVLTSVADSFIRSNGVASNFGGAVGLHIDPHAPATERTLIRFGVSSVPPGTLEAAILTLCPTKTKAAATGRIHEVHRILGDWSEAGVNWDNQPPVRNVPTDASEYLGGLECVDFDVSDDVAAWINGEANFGWMLSDEVIDTSSAQVIYASRENADTSLAPRLTITFDQ